MTSLRNSVQLIGRLGKDPETTNFDSGKMKVRFSLATSESYRNSNGEKVEETQWHNIVCWNGTAKIAADYLKKGKEIALEGKLTNRSWEDNDGQKHYITEVIANQILLLDRKSE
jgi:single-strand DNA-binding protein